MTYINPRQKLFWHIDKLEQIRATGKTDAPVNVEIDLSNRCSHGCRWCRFAYTHTRGPLAGKGTKPANHVGGGDLMDFNLACHILFQMQRAGVQSVTWTGGGEPTLHPRFEDIALHAHHTGLQQGIYTHGGHLDVEKAALLRALFTFVYISLDECTAEAFRASKGVDRFQAVVDNVYQLARMSGAATVGVGFLLHRHNHHQIDDMVALGKTLGVNYVQFRPLISYNAESPSLLNEDTDWLNDAIAHLELWRNESFVVADVDRFRMYRDWTGHGYNTCHWSALQTVVTPNGKMWRCTDKREHADALLGDLSVESLAAVWARAGTCQVNDTCRLMCRGHIANLTLDSIMTEPAHKAFI